MKIVHYQTTTGQTAYGRLHADGRTTRLAGDIFGELTDTGEPASIAKLLAPIEPRDIICIGLNPNSLGIRTILNGQTMQDWNTDDMIFDVPTLIEFLSGSTRLAAGTVILTGTPHGVGGARKPPVFLQPGDTVTIEIDGIGKLTNPVIAEGENE